MELVNQVKELYEKSPALAVIVSAQNELLIFALSVSCLYSLINPQSTDF